MQLTEEEKEVLHLQGLPIPTCLPLTSVERKALQSVRRRLKAKVHLHAREECVWRETFKWEMCNLYFVH